MYLIVKISECGMSQSIDTCDTIEDAKIEFNEWENEMRSCYEDDDIHISKDRLNGCVWLFENDENDNHELFEGDFQESIMIINQNN